MGVALELLTGFVTAPSTTFTGLTMAAGNSLNIRNAPIEARPQLLSAWADNQGAGNLRIRSPRMHDNTQGIRLGVVISEPRPLLPFLPRQGLYPQDTLTVELTGSATGGDIETACLLIYYPDLPGIDARLIGVEELMTRARNILTIENSLATGTAGGYSGEEAINAEIDLLKANEDYALIGYAVSAECATVRWRGADTGNLGIGGPGCIGMDEILRRWFIFISEESGLPLIPVFNSANKAAILLDAAQDENGADVIVTSIFAELGPSA